LAEADVVSARAGIDKYTPVSVVSARALAATTAARRPRVVQEPVMTVVLLDPMGKPYAALQRTKVA
jgi:hypothetical protein